MIMLWRRNIGAFTLVAMSAMFVAVVYILNAVQSRPRSYIAFTKHLVTYSYN